MKLPIRPNIKLYKGKNDLQNIDWYSFFENLIHNRNLYVLQYTFLYQNKLTLTPRINYV